MVTGAGYGDKGAVNVDIGAGKEGAVNGVEGGERGRGAGLRVGDRGNL